MSVDSDSCSFDEDARHMNAALALARRGLGQVWPNPAVGCVLVHQGRVVGRGWTQPGGRPHAETEALRRAAERTHGATAFITLEPCNHHGRTMPCTEALIASGVARAVVTVEDPDPRVSGQGIARLRAAGIAVRTGVCAAAASDLNVGFFLRIVEQRPMFTFKTAASLDGRIATRTGESRWISGEEARAFAHKMRKEHDAVLVGSGTVLADDPALTCRLPGLSGRSPIRIIVDGRLRLSTSTKIAETASKIPTWMITLPGADDARRQALAKHGITIIEVESDNRGHPDVKSIATALAQQGLTRVLIEGGGQLAASFLAAGLVDRIAWFHAPRIVGNDGLPSVGSLGANALSEAPSFVRTGIRELAGDMLLTCRRVGGD